MLTIETCSFCRGRGIVQSLEERRTDGDWHPNTMLAHDVADAWIAADSNAPLRWVDVACPSCHGDKTVMIEHVTCKIF